MAHSARRRHFHHRRVTAQFGQRLIPDLRDPARSAANFGGDLRQLSPLHECALDDMPLERSQRIDRVEQGLWDIEVVEMLLIPGRIPHTNRPHRIQRS